MTVQGSIDLPFRGRRSGSRAERLPVGLDSIPTVRQAVRVNLARVGHLYMSLARCHPRRLDGLLVNALQGCLAPPLRSRGHGAQTSRQRHYLVHVRRRLILA